MKRFLSILATMLICLSVWATKSDVVTSNSVGATVSFSSSGSYEWEWDSTNQRLRSTNYHVRSSTSRTTITITTTSSCEFSFDYAVSSESNYDELSITLDGSTIVNDISGKSSNTYNGTLSSGNHSLVLNYSKDDSSDSNDDRAYVSNIKFGAPFVSTQFILNGVKYKTLIDGTVEVIENSYTGAVTIPSSVKYENTTYTISAISSDILANCTSVSLPIYYNFGNNSTLKKLYIEEGPTTFTGFSSCTALEDVSLPGSITSISGSFTNCTSLKTVAFRYGTTKLKGLEECSSYGGTFRNCKIDSIFVDREFDFSFTSTYSSPFSWNGTKHTLRVIRIGDNLKTVQANMFYNCNELKTIILGNSLVTIENGGFGDCEKVEGDLVMPSTLKTIGNNAFSWGWHNAGNGNLVLNEGLETIGASAFAYCPKLNIENIPSTVTSIGNSAFSDCKFEKLTIPSKVTSIGQYAFGTITGKLTIEDGTSTLSLSQFAFNNSGSKYNSLYLGRNISHNESSCGPFEYYHTSAHTLQNVEIGDKVTSIPANTFYNCSALETVTIGSKVSSIGKDAFYRTGVTKIITKATTAPTLSAQEFSGKPVYVPAGSKASYLAKDYWKNNIIIDPNDELITVNLTMPGTLEGRLRIQKVEPTNVNKLKITGEMNDDDWAYIKKTNMPNMYSLDLSEATNTSIPAQQFQSHTYLVNAVLPNGITTIGDNAFEGSNLSGDFSMPSSLEQIGNYAFKGTKIGNVSLSSNVTIGNYAFNNSKLKSITLNKCTSIGQYAFAGCSNLSGSYQLYSQLTAIPDYAFQNCSSLVGIELPTTLKTIGDGAFQNCSKLTSIEFHNAITSFGSTTSSFAGCSGIKTIKTHWQRPISTLSTTFDSVDKSNCTLYVPNGSTDWYLITTGWKEFISVVEYDETESLGSITINDSEEFESVPGLYSSLTYTRNFKNTGWQELYVPFAMSYNDWKNDFEVGYIEGFLSRDTNNDGEIDETIWSGVKITEGTLLPNTPYIIRAKTTGNKTITLNNATLYATEENSIDCSSTTMRYVFKGVYESESFASVDDYPYYLNNGVFNLVPRIVPFRWTLRFESRGTSFVIHPNLTRGMVRENDGTPFEEYVENNQDLFVGYKVYTLDGSMIDMTSETLKPGFYVKNGKKVLVK